MPPVWRCSGPTAPRERTVDDLAAAGELARPTLWVFGNEAWGLPAEHAALLDRLVALPIYGRAESLNLVHRRRGPALRHRHRAACRRLLSLPTASAARRQARGPISRSTD